MILYTLVSKKLCPFEIGIFLYTVYIRIVQDYLHMTVLVFLFLWFIKMTSSILIYFLGCLKTFKFF